MNLRNADRDHAAYSIGLDIGTGSVGWAVLDADGNLMHFKGKPTWGSRLFPSAQTASDTRMARSQRRRYDRRRQRLNHLQELFCPAMKEVDPDFFLRLNQSRLLKEDRDPKHADYRYPLFNDLSFTEVDYYKKFPTIYHVRRHLMESCEKEDLRIIYLALHNIVKSRGNFLWQDNPSLSARNANANDAIRRLVVAIQEWCADHDIVQVGEPDIKAIQDILTQPINKSSKWQQVRAALRLGPTNRAMADALSKSVFGYVVEFGNVFGNRGKEGSKFSLDNDEKVEEYRYLCPDEGTELFESLCAMRSAIILMEILEGGDGRTISYHKCDEYDHYGNDLRLLKSLVREYVPEKYSEVFRGEHINDTRWKHEYDPAKVKGYTKYNLSRGQAYDVFKRYVAKLFVRTKAVDDSRYIRMMAAFEEERFLRRLKTSDNGSIPYQLHLEEMHAIIQKQGEFYPFLLENQDKLESLITFRIPYYIGPLTQKNAPVDSSGKARFAWSVRKEGEKGHLPIRPWNWHEIIDKDRSAEAFIRRMTGTCTYLYGEPVLPKSSLLYERFCVLNELNGARYSFDGDDWRRFSFADREGIYEELFKRRGTVSYKAVSEWLRKRHPGLHPQVRGGQGENGFESKLTSHRFFCKILGIDEINGTTEAMIENIILWNTLFEDRKILRQRLATVYGKQGTGALNVEQIDKICKKRFSGWGRLSKRLLSEIKVKFDGRRLSIMDILFEGLPYGRVGSAMVFMEILHDKELDFQCRIDDINRQSAADGGLVLEDIPGSPALRRSVNQAMRIVAEIVSIAGCEPSNIYIETTREGDKSGKGRRTNRRFDRIDSVLKAFNEDGGLDPDVFEQFKGMRGKEINDRLALYFLQNGKCMYSGNPLDIHQLSAYQIDHIIPRSYVKDDSLENLVLVLPSANQSKSDSLLIDGQVRRKMARTWRALHHAGMIGDKKYRNLMRAHMSDQQMRGFIARQLVETSQIVKYVRMMLEMRYQNTNVRSIKAELSHQLREAQGYVKCREANDYHHAHDALLVCELGRFIQLRYGDIFDNPVGIEHAMRTYIRSLNSERKQAGCMFENVGMIVGTFEADYVDHNTGEILWEGRPEVEKLRRYLNYKDCYISRMSEIATGAFWDQNAISPKKGKKMLPLKKGLDCRKYGGYTTADDACYLIYRGKVNGKESSYFAHVPIMNASRIVKNGLPAAEEFAITDAREKQVEYVRLERAYIPKYQLIEIAGERFYLTARREVRNGTQLAFSQKEMKLLKILADGISSSRSDSDVEQLNGISEERLIKFYDALIDKLSVRACRLNKQLKLHLLRDGFINACVDEQARAIISIIMVANATNNRANLAAIGGPKAAGCIQPTFNKELNFGGGNFVIIDQSVTGMFERRYQVGL